MHATDSDHSREEKQAGLQHRHANVCQDAPGRLSGSKTSQSVTRPGREEAAGAFCARVSSNTEREFKNTFALRNGRVAHLCVCTTVCVCVCLAVCRRSGCIQTCCKTTRSFSLSFSWAGSPDEPKASSTAHSVFPPRYITEDGFPRCHTCLLFICSFCWPHHRTRKTAFKVA